MTLYTIRNGHQTVGLSDLFGGRLCHYVVVFERVVVARKVMYSLPQKGKALLRLDRGRPQPIYMTTTPATFPRCVVMDTEAKLYIKQDRDAHQDQSDYFIDTMPGSSAYLVPFKNNVGIIIPRRMTEESVAEMEFDCSVIEPSQDEESFRTL